MYRLVGLVVKASASRAEDLGFKSRLRRARDFVGSSHTSDFNFGTPVATLPGTWHYRVSAGTGWPGVSTLWLGEVESWICNFYLSVAARKIVQIRPWDTLACCWDVKQPTKTKTTTKKTYLVFRHNWHPSFHTAFCDLALGWQSQDHQKVKHVVFIFLHIFWLVRKKIDSVEAVQVLIYPDAILDGDFCSQRK